MKLFRTILCGRDSSADARCAMEEACRIADSESGRLIVVQAVPLPWIEQSQEDYDLPIDEILDAYRAEIQAEIASLGRDHVPVEIEVRLGSPMQVLEAAAADLQADLLVIGARGETSAGKDSVRLGSNASACLRAVRLPVLLVGRNRPGPFKRIAACTDLGPASHAVLECAAKIAVDDSGCLDVVHALRPPWMQDDIFTKWWKDRDSEDFRKQFLEVWTARLDAAVRASAQFFPIEIENHLVPAPEPSLAVVQFIRDRGSDLVVIGRHSHGPLARLLLGSTAEKILRSVDTSVLVASQSAEE